MAQKLTTIRGEGFYPNLPPSLAFIQGSVFYVKPSTGSNSNSGNSPDAALKTLAAALAKCTAGKNDTVVLFGESNTAGSTTDYQSSTLAWNKDLTHLIGVNAGGRISNRSRVAFISTYVTASNLFTLSANGCRIQGVEFFAGVADANPTGCLKVTGSRNVISGCHIAGIGHASMDIAGGYSVKLDGAEENEFIDCQIGADTIAAGSAANADLLVDGAAARNYFENCRFARLIEHASNFAFVQLADATAIDRWLHFKGCTFIPTSTNYAYALAGVMKVPVLTQGVIVVEDCVAVPSDASTAPKWDANDSDKIMLFNSPTPAADTAGVARPV